MSVSNHNKKQVERVIDNLLSSKDELVQREIEASASQDRYDRHGVRYQQEQFDNAREVAVQEILRMIARRGS